MSKRELAHKKSAAAGGARRRKTDNGKRKPTVRGPQGELPLGPANGDYRTQGRTPRLRYVEPRQHKDGNPFYALRVPSAVLDAFKRKAKPSPAAMVRAFMSKVSGVELESSDE